MAAFKANEISSSLRRLQRNSILNQQEIQLLNRILELLKIYDVWCRDDGAGSDLNFHDSKESNYNSRDDASSQIPRDIKFILVQISSHSERLEDLLNEWEEGFVIKIADSYALQENLIKEKNQITKIHNSWWFIKLTRQLKIAAKGAAGLANSARLLLRRYVLKRNL